MTEYSREDHRAATMAWIKAARESLPDDVAEGRDLNEALYTFDELGNLDLGVDRDQAIMIWAIVETVRREGFPKKLRM